MHINIFSVFLLTSICSCNAVTPQPRVPSETSIIENNKSKVPATIRDVLLPKTFERTVYPPQSFAYWLQDVPLKKDNTVYLYDGSLKHNQTAQYAVLDITTGNQNLQQCADAVMRLRAEYLYSLGLYNLIHFTDNEGRQYRFTQPYKRPHFMQYLNTVFGMCGSASLAKELVPVNINDIQAGDVFIRGGFPGHAVIVMDVAENNEGEKVFMIAQSYMPAQDIHVLRNPLHDEPFAWYTLSDAEEIITPEYIFKKTELKRWK